jgi:hypothetical protein
MSHRWDDVDFEQEVLHVRRTMNRRELVMALFQTEMMKKRACLPSYQYDRYT